MAAPRGAPENVIGLLNQIVTQAFRDATVAERFSTLGMRLLTQTREQGQALCPKPSFGLK
jgi:hypothetical protein